MRANSQNAVKPANALPRVGGWPVQVDTAVNKNAMTTNPA